MSLSQLQKAVALLIRLPEHHRGEQLEGFLEKFTLDDAERTQVRALAADPGVTKFGRSMSGVRGETLQEHLRLSRAFLAPDVLDALRMLFEPEAVHVRFGELAPRFLDFILTDARARQMLAETAPPFIFDVLTLEREQMRFRRELSPERCPPPSGTRLAHAAFRLVTLEHDVPRLLDARSDDPSRGAPDAADARRRVVLLLVASPDRPGCRMFEIDAATEQFLAAQARGETEIAAPESLSDLVAIGLCRPLP